MKTKLLLIVFTILFTSSVVAVFASDRLYSMSLAAQVGKISPEKGIALIEAAIRITPGDVRLYVQKYDLMSLPTDTGRPTPYALRPKPGDLLYERQLQVIARCIDLCPSWAAYHFNYAQNMRRVHPRMSLMATKFLLSEFKKASDLRPMSQLYRKMYEKYDQRYGGK